MLCPWARHFIGIASVDSAVKCVPGGDNLEKGVQCYEFFGGIALKNHELLFFTPQFIIGFPIFSLENIVFVNVKETTF